MHIVWKERIQNIIPSNKIGLKGGDIIGMQQEVLDIREALDIYI